MKSQIFHALQSAPRLRKRDIWLTLIPALIWLGAVSARPYVIQAHCVKNPANCVASTVLAVDQPGLGLDSTQADQYSGATQTWSGVFALAVPLLWNTSLGILGVATPGVALVNAGTDLVIILQTVSWNGAINETTRLFAQRPRPYVYANPAMGQNVSNYTSFYSGHTSFAAAASVGLVLALIGRHAPTLLLILAGSLAQIMIVSTAAFRVLAGRHFLTDVLVGTVAGTLVAIAVAYAHRPKFLE